jgi:hypothetical protein
MAQTVKTPLLVEIPFFPGFYGSDLSDSLDREEEQWIEYEAAHRQEEEGIPPELRLDEEELGELVFKHMDYGCAHRSLAKDYAATLDYVATDRLGFKTGITFESMSSPREYNFATDRLFVHMPRATIARLFRESRKEDHATLLSVIKERHTSRSGFISFYRAELREWLSKPLSQWDHNELGTLFLAAVRREEADAGVDRRDFYEGWEADIRENMNEDFDRAFENGMNWTGLEADVKELRAEKEEDLRRLDPDYVAPPVRCPATLDLFRDYGAEVRP